MIESYSTWFLTPSINNVNFVNFKSELTSCGAKQSIFTINPKAYDLVPITYVNNAKFTNVAYNAIIFIYNPPQIWAAVNDCGEWPCTAPSNAVYTFKSAVFEVPDGLTTLPTFWTAGTTTSYNF